MDVLTSFGWFASVAMLLSYAGEARGPHWTLAFAGSCALASVYGYLQGAWPVALTEAVWTAVAATKWRARVRAGDDARREGACPTPRYRPTQNARGTPTP